MKKSILIMTSLAIVVAAGAACARPLNTVAGVEASYVGVAEYYKAYPGAELNCYVLDESGKFHVIPVKPTTVFIDLWRNIRDWSAPVPILVIDPGEAIIVVDDSLQGDAPSGGRIVGETGLDGIQFTIWGYEIRVTIVIKKTTPTKSDTPGDVVSMSELKCMYR